VNRQATIRCLAATSLFILALSASALKRSRDLKVRVRFLATSTIVRGSWAYNQDTYLAEFIPSSGDEQVLVRLVDEYFNAAPPISHEALTSSTGTILRVRRDSQCDLPYTDILLRTKPEDPMAILPERLGYEPKLDSTPDPSTVIPCYRTVRQ
jgi:hypothetical protein